MNIKKIISSVGIGAGAIILGLGIQYVLADSLDGSFKNATCAPPECNTAAPINVGSSIQYKTGDSGNANPGIVIRPAGSSQTMPSGTLFDVVGTALMNSLYTGNLNVTDTNTSLAKANCPTGSAGCENGYVLMNDGSGNATWVSTSSLGIGGSGNSSTTINNFTHYVPLYSNTTWTVPADVTQVRVDVWGGGGGGAYIPGVGGSAATPRTATIDVSPEQTLTVTVGSGGSPGFVYVDQTCPNDSSREGGTGGGSRITFSGGQPAIASQYATGGMTWYCSGSTNGPGTPGTTLDGYSAGAGGAAGGRGGDGLVLIIY